LQLFLLPPELLYLTERLFAPNRHSQATGYGRLKKAIVSSVSLLWSVSSSMERAPAAIAMRC